MKNMRKRKKKYWKEYNTISATACNEKGYPFIRRWREIVEFFVKNDFFLVRIKIWQYSESIKEKCYVPNG